MQKRGVMVDADDFQNVTNTYEKHELSDKKPRFETSKEMVQHRKNVEQQDVLKKKHTNE